MHLVVSPLLYWLLLPLVVAAPASPPRTPRLRSTPVSQSLPVLEDLPIVLRLDGPATDDDTVEVVERTLRLAAGVEGQDNHAVPVVADATVPNNGTNMILQLFHQGNREKQFKPHKR